MKILVTAFDAFGGEEINPTERALDRLPDHIGGAQLIKHLLPTVFGGALKQAVAVAEKEDVDAVVSLGQAGGRSHITPEWIGINLADASIPDNEGNQPSDKPVVDGGPAAYFSTLPVKAMVAAIQDAELPARVSTTAGTFVCNQLLYGLLHHFKDTQVKAGFIHVPFIKEQAKENSPMLELADVVRGVECAISAVAKTA
ncbi:pyroglutamyl-peptidase I [Corynebacterium macginleyi]|uniref:pyroglutamyl-peptidase I n=1 Tax=Corynebacterium macginleyi TaxID=38290 RepID=UPI00190C5077|nr:pyroglutamyl-peptidase I [Corynebacterium macginleyi]